MEEIRDFDIIIIGGSYAGLSAAMALGRSLRRVLVIDSGLPCNRQTPHSQNFITHDGEKPSEIARKAKEDVLKYDTVSFLNDAVISGEKAQGRFTVITQSGKEFYANKLILASGIKDIIPDIKGFVECWGISVVHCPYCHGFEFRDKNTAILADGDKAFHLAALVNNLTEKLTIITNSADDFTEEQLQKIKHHNIEIIPSPIKEIEHTNGFIEHVVFSDATKRTFDVLYAALPYKQHSDIAVLLGCEFTENDHIKLDSLQETTVSGVYACGDNSNMMRSVANAVYSGNLTGALVNGKLVEERF